ncbi:MAG: VWA domain-containing protein, partial [Methylocystis sp.]|nr:VWA domain-containing protein [Methylocystis sp.]
KATAAERKADAAAQGFASRFDIFDKLKSIKSSWDWRGCLEGPKYPFNVNDTAPNPSDPETLFVPFLAPDEPNNDNDYGNSYISDNGAGCSSAGSDWDKLTNTCKYRVATSASNSRNSPNDHCPNPATQTLMQLTSNKASVTSKISQLEEGGNTNLHEGFMWGWRTLSPNQPFAGGRSYNAPKNRKIMVFMTDGYNNWKSQTNTATGSTYQALGYYSYNGAANVRFPDGTMGNRVNYQDTLKVAANSNSDYHDESRNMQDELTLQACTNAKAQGIEIFTIGFSTPDDQIDTQGLNLMKSCATNEDHYFKAENAAQLNAAFNSIGFGLGKLRLSQ